MTGERHPLSVRRQRGLTRANGIVEREHRGAAARCRGRAPPSAARGLQRWVVWGVTTGSGHRTLGRCRVLPGWRGTELERLVAALSHPALRCRCAVLSSCSTRETTFRALGARRSAQYGPRMKHHVGYDPTPSRASGLCWTPRSCSSAPGPCRTPARKTAISLPDDTFERVERAAKKIGVSRSELFARAAERWLDALDDDQTTDAINRAIAGLPDDHAFTNAAATALARAREHP